jgi:hypothetical protein
MGWLRGVDSYPSREIFRTVCLRDTLIPLEPNDHTLRDVDCLPIGQEKIFECFAYVHA